MLAPSAFEYVLNIRDFYVDTTGVYNPKAEKEKYVQKSEKIKKVLKSKKYDFRDLQDSNYDLNSASYLGAGFVVTLKSLDDLRELKKILSEYDYIYASVGEVFYEDQNAAEQILIRRLIGKAVKKAMLIASETDLKLGKILEVKEVKEIDNLTFNIMDMYISTGKKERLGVNNGSLKSNISKAMVIKFAAE